jgi:hypothetical protein
MPGPGDIYDDSIVLLPNRRRFEAGVWVEDPPRPLLFTGAEWVEFGAADALPDDWSKWADSIPDEMLSKVTLPDGNPRKVK